MKKDNFVSIGKIVRSQGRRGELRFKPYFEISKKLFFSRIIVKNKEIPVEFQVESLRPLKDFYIIKLKGIDTIAQAGDLVGEIIFLRENDLFPLEKDEYYYFHITGCAVILTNGEKIGEVEDFISMCDNELLVVRGKGAEIYIAFTADICREVNLNKKEIVIDPPKGLLDLNEI